MSFFAPIAGNESFSSVDNVAAAIQNLDVADAKINNASTVSLNLIGVGLTDAGSQAGRGVVYRAVGYSPVFTSTAAGSGFYFNSRPNIEAQTTSGVGAAVNTNLLLIPDNAIIQQVSLINNSRDANGDLEDIAGGGNGAGGLVLGLQDVQIASLSLTFTDASLKSALVTNGAEAAALNAGAIVLKQIFSVDATTNAIGGTGATTAVTEVVVTQAATGNGVILGNTAGGDALTSATAPSTTNPTQGPHLVIIVDYLMPGDGTVPGPVASGVWSAADAAIVP